MNFLVGIVLNKQHKPKREVQRAKANTEIYLCVCVSEREREIERANRNIIFKISRSSMIWIAGIILFHKIYLLGNQPLRWYGNGMAYGKSNTFSLNSICLTLYLSLSPSFYIHTMIYFHFVDKWYTVPISFTLTRPLPFLLALFLYLVLSLVVFDKHTQHTRREKEILLNVCAYQNPFKHGHSIFTRMLSNLFCKCKH